MKDQEIYKKLKQLRKERGLTLNTLAEKMGADYQQISRIERGKSRLTIDVLMKMAEALEIPLKDIVEGENRPQNEDNKVIAFASQKPDISVTQEMLATILEKIDLILYDTKAFLNPQTKAAIASQIYGQALRYHQEKNDIHATQNFIAYSIGLVKTLLEGNGQGT